MHGHLHYVVLLLLHKSEIAPDDWSAHSLFRDSALYRGVRIDLHMCMCRSKEWGVMPVHWYISSALPRGLLATLPLSVVGVTREPRLRPLAASVVAFIAIYSCLGHKEV